MAEAPNQGPQLTGQVPFYKNPEPLSAERHANLGLRRSDTPLAFARETNVVPITVGEFGPAATCYPIIFAGPNRVPLVVMGLRSGTNLYIGDDGRIQDDMYLPAFVRRYPFVFAEVGAQENKPADNLVVCIDTASDLVVDGGDVPFFEGGKPTDFTNDAIEFLKSFEQQRLSTERLSTLFTELDLFEEKTINFQPRPNGENAGEPFKIADYYAVSMDKLNALPADKFVELRDNGALSAAHAHHLSLLNWQRIIERAIRSNVAAQTAAVN